MNRRNLMSGGAAAAIALFDAPAPFCFGFSTSAEAKAFRYTRSEADWRKLLGPARYAVLRGEATERAGSSKLNHERRKGVFHCAGCGLAAYSSAAKYDSGTGWPSFWQALPGAIGTKGDRALVFLRTEVHCSRCGGHFGHVFDDGPAPTGKRHCLNGAALDFRPIKA